MQISIRATRTLNKLSIRPIVKFTRVIVAFGIQLEIVFIIKKNF